MFKIHFSIERWKFNKEYDVYVSSWGNVKDINKKDKPVFAKDNYIVVEISGKLRPVHRIVLETFKPKGKRLTVDHIDHNTRNNHLYNLRWLTKEENENDNNRTEIFQKCSNRKLWKKLLTEYQMIFNKTYQGRGFFLIQQKDDVHSYRVSRKQGREFARHMNENETEASEKMGLIKGDYCNPTEYNGFIYTWFPSFSDYLRVKGEKSYELS